MPSLRGPVALVLPVLAALLLPSAASAATRHVWVVAEPQTWNAVPNGRDAIHGAGFDPAQTTFPTVVYKRYTKDWKRPLRLPYEQRAGAGGIPGPLIRARVGDKLRIHFKNRDTLHRQPHSMHFHGVEYQPSSDGVYLPLHSGKGGLVRPGQSFTYELTAGPALGRRVAVPRPLRLDGGLDRRRHVRRAVDRGPQASARADREYLVAFAPWHGFQTINGRAFVGNTPVFESRVGDTVQWDVMAMGDEFHTFHVHGHRWRTDGGTPEDTRGLGPAESFRVRWKEDAPGTWLYHCHVETHMAQGMIGLYRVRR